MYTPSKVSLPKYWLRGFNEPPRRLTPERAFTFPLAGVVDLIDQTYSNLLKFK